MAAPTLYRVALGHDGSDDLDHDDTLTTVMVIPAADADAAVAAAWPVLQAAYGEKADAEALSRALFPDYDDYVHGEAFLTAEPYDGGDDL